MKNLSNYQKLPVLLSLALVIVLAGSVFGQKPWETKTAIGNLADAQAVNVTPLNLLSVEDAKAPVRQLFKKRITVSPNGLGFSIVAMNIPAGKRLVIENVSAIVRCPEGRRMDVNYFTYVNNGDGVAKKTFHVLVLQKQGSFNGSGIFAANRKGLVFADEQIGGEHFSVGVSARLSAANAGFAQAQFTFTGYTEDLPAVR
jgi:hypothetical protein